MSGIVKTVLICTVISLLYGCRQPENKTTVSFYYWQQSNYFTDSSASYIDRHNIRRFYVHLLDVVWNTQQQGPEPIAISALSAPNPVALCEWVPVIFIHNQVIEKTDSAGLSVLSGNIISAARAFMNKAGRNDLTEIQIDCDWTPGTRDKYFHLLRLLKQAGPEIIYSATIRLYPFKYDHLMGVPPVDYGVLMLYNLSPIKDIKEVNSIFTYNELIKYRRNSAYPIPLKPILPVFGWYAWFRGSSYKNIVYAPPGLVSTPFFEKQTATQYRVTGDTVINGNYLRKGDILRNEFPEKNELLALSKNLSKMPLNSEEIIFYHWNESTVQYYAPVIKAITAH